MTFLGTKTGRDPKHCLRLRRKLGKPSRVMPRGPSRLAAVPSTGYLEPKKVETYAEKEIPKGRRSVCVEIDEMKILCLYI